MKFPIKLFIIASILLGSCNSFYNKVKEKRMYHENSKLWVGKKITGIDSLYILNDTVREKNDFSILHYFDAGCSTCIEELLKWSTYYKDYLRKNDEIEYIFISASEQTDFIRYQLKDLNFPFDILLDTGYHFQTINKLFEISDVSFLMTGNDSIILYGSPYKDETLMEKYNEILANE